MPLKSLRSSLINWLLLVGVWELLVRAKLLNPIFFASPSGVLSQVWSRDFVALFALDAAASLANISFASFVGYVLAYIVLFIGLQHKALYRFLLQINILFKYFPIPALIPFGILFFGINNAAKVFIITFSVFILYFGHIITIIQKEEMQYTALQRSWNINRWQRFWSFVFPISNFLNYRILGNLVIWIVSTSIIVEMILGGEYGFGSRLLQLQQLYQINQLFGYLTGIILISLLFEKLLRTYFARLYLDTKKAIAGGLLIAGIIASIFYQFQDVRFNDDTQNTVITYKAALNLPIYVMIERFNSLDLDLQTVSSGVQAMDALQSGKTSIGGYVDIPNALSGISQNDSLKISSQAVETKTQPTLFFISNQGEEITGDNFSAINGGSVGYFPNNPLIQSGFEFTAFTKQANPNSLDMSGSNDPATLVQSFVSGTIDSVIAPEPYISQIEKQSDSQRINPDFSLIQGINFDTLPLAALVLNTSLLTPEEVSQVSQDIEQSIVYIRNNTTNNRASGELRDILTKYGFDTDLLLSAFQTNTEVDFEDTEQMIELIKLIDSQNNFEDSENLEKNDFYIQDTREK